MPRLSIPAGRGASDAAPVRWGAAAEDGVVEWCVRPTLDARRGRSFAGVMTPGSTRRLVMRRALLISMLTIALAAPAARARPAPPDPVRAGATAAQPLESVASAGREDAAPSKHAAVDDGSDATTYVLILAACGSVAGLALAARRARRRRRLPAA
jgi:hypothetical protein